MPLVRAQKGVRLDIVTISIDDPALNKQEIPFDVPFYILINGLTGYNSIQLTYGIKDFYKKKSWVSLPTPNFSDSLYVSNEVTVINDQATLYCPGIHPNMTYNFRLNTKKGISKDPAFQDGLKDRIIKTINNFFDTNALSDLDTNDMAKLCKDIDKNIYAYLLLKPEESLVTADGKPYETNYTIYEDLIDGLNNASDEIKNSKNSIGDHSQGIPAIRELFSQESDNILDQLNLIFDSETKWIESFKKQLISPVDRSIFQLNDHTLSEGLEILKQLAMEPKKIEDILEGELKIEKKLLVKAEGYDLPTINFLVALIEKINSGVIRIVTEQGEQTIMADPNFNKIHTLLVNIRPYYKKIIEAENNISLVKQKIRQQAIDLLVSSSLSQNVIAIPEVETAKSNYYSIEAGIGGATGFSSIFGYYVANIYFTPVNKNAPLSTFKKWNKFFKMFSVQVGIANFLATRPEYTYSFLGNNSSKDFMLGIGFRLNKLVRINTGTILYRSNKANPIIDKYSVRPSIYFSAGIDINFLTVLKDAIKVFNP